MKHTDKICLITHPLFPDIVVKVSHSQLGQTIRLIDNDSPDVWMAKCLGVFARLEKFTNAEAVDLLVTGTSGKYKSWEAFAADIIEWNLYRVLYNGEPVGILKGTITDTHTRRKIVSSIPHH